LSGCSRAHFAINCRRIRRIGVAVYVIVVWLKFNENVKSIFFNLLQLDTKATAHSQEINVAMQEIFNEFQ